MPAASFPADFLWGVATAGHQNEGDNVDSDTWFLENVTPTIFQERSGKATNGWERWESDLDLVAGMGLNAYRFSVEWARVEPVEGEFSEEALGALRGGGRRMPRPRPRADRHVQPLHVAALVRGARRVAERRGTRALRPLLRRRHGPLRRPHRARRDLQRARPARDAHVGGPARLHPRARARDARRRERAPRASSGTAPATSCCARTSPACGRA